MIVGIKGKLIRSTPISAVIEAGGLFYELNIPVTTAEKLPREGSEVCLHTLAVYREDSQALYGFYDLDDRDFFKTLVEKVSGIGPKIALNMISGMSVATLKNAISSGDVALLSKCPGIGKKTAERLIVELRGAIVASSGISVRDGAQGSPESTQSDALAALVALGFKLPDADKAVRAAVLKLGADASTEAIIKASLSR